MTGPCIFCGQVTQLTDAHIFRKGWIAHLYPAMDRFRHQRRAYLSGDAGESVWFAGSADLKVKDVCRVCYEGWMHRLDYAAENLFATHAALGFGAKLDRVSDRRTLAHWCSMVAVLLDRISSVSRLSSETQRAVFSGVGQLLVQLFMRTDETNHEGDLNREVNRAVVRQLWPDRLFPIVWPPPESIPGDQIETFCETFRRVHPLRAA